MKQRKRQPYILLGLVLAIPGLIGLAFATTQWLLFVSAFVIGIFPHQHQPDWDAICGRGDSPDCPKAHPMG